MTITIKEMLSEITTRDDAGVHFTSRYPEDMIKHCELAGLIKIHRPVHAATGMDFDIFHWTVELTKDGLEFVNEMGDKRKYDDDGHKICRTCGGDTSLNCPVCQQDYDDDYFYERFGE